jgi:hypothetical protein
VSETAVTNVAISDNALTVEQILRSPAEFDHEITVRSIGPAIVAVLEAEAPLRFEVLASTEQEACALRAWLETNTYASHVWAAYLEAQAAQQDQSVEFSREDVHASRLERAQPMRLRVSAR